MKNFLNKLFIIFTVITLAFSFNFISLASEDYGILKINQDQPDEELFEDEESLDDDYYSEYDSEEDRPTKNFYSFSSEDVTLTNEYIAGDVFIFSTGKVSIIDTTISGNLFVFSPNIELNENTLISASAFIASEKADISSSFDGNAYILSKELNLTEDFDISLDIFASAQNATINGEIYGDVNVSASNISVSEDAHIEGKLNKNTFEENTEPQKRNVFVSWIFSFLSYVILAILLFLLYNFAKSKIIKSNDNLVKNIGKYILFGILGLIIVPIVSIVLLIISITANISLLLLGLYIILLFISSATLLINIAIFVANKYKDKIKIENNILRTSIIIIVLSIVYKLLQLVPVISTLITIACTIVGLGIIINLSLFNNNLNEN